MKLTFQTKQVVCERAGYACEYCGVTEQNAGGELTIDHFQPQSKGGGDELENLVYQDLAQDSCHNRFGLVGECQSCVRCNLYKSDFWNEASSEPNLWNLRLEPEETHFWLADDGRLLALTEVGELSIRILK